MATDDRTREDLLAEIDDLRYRLEETEETLRAIGSGEVDAFVVTGPEGEQVFTLKGAEQPYRVLVESMNEGAATLAADGTILYCNNCLAAMLRVPLERLIGTRLDAYAAPADRPVLAARLENYALDCNRAEIALINVEGYAVPVLLSCFASDLSAGGGISVVITDLTQQKRNEEIMASERLAHSIIEQAGEALIVCDEKGRVIRASRIAHQLCAENPLLKPFDELFHLLISETDCLFSVITPLRGGCFESVEVEHNQGEDEVSYLLLNATPLMSDHNRIIGCVVSCADITERKKADEALALAHAETVNEKHRLEAVMKALPVGLAILDAQGGNISSNSAFEQVWGSPRDPVSTIDDYTIYQAWWVDTGRLVRPEEWASARAVQHGETVVTQEMEIQRFDGTRAFVLNSAAPIRDSEGHITGCAVAIMDITGRRQAEEALRAIEERYRLATMATNDAIWDINLTTGMIHWNDNYATAYGRPPETEDSWQWWVDHIHPEDRECTVGGLREALDSIRNSWTFEYRFLRADGKWAHICDRAYIWRDGSGKACRVVGAMLDLTERKKAEEALNRAHDELEKKVEERTLELTKTVAALQNEIVEREKLKQQLLQAQKMESIGLLAGGVAHDFNNLLTGIGGYAQVIQDSLPAEDEPLQESVGQIMAGVERATELTRSLLAFSRKQLMNRKPVLVNAIIDNAGKFIRRVIGEDVEFRTAYGGNEMHVLADTGQIEQVFMNLAINSRDAMPNGGCLSISTQEVLVKERSVEWYDLSMPGKYARISIADTGSGIDKTFMGRIFEPFFTTKEVGKGTGLGLSIVHGIIKQHGGSILVSSEPGRGATFDIYLPLVEERVARDETKMSAPVAGGTETLLIAEDEEIVKSLLKKTFEKAGYRVVVAADGNEALARFREHDDIALVLSDVVMPGKNGKEIFAEMKKMKPGIRFIFISGYTADIIRERCEIDEDAVLIAKPFSKNDILLKIRELLDRG